MPFSSYLVRVFQRRWARAIGFTVLWLAAIVAAAAANGCLFDLNGSHLVLLGAVITWTWLLLLFLFVAHWGGRVLIVIAAISVLLLVPTCVLTMSPVVRAALLLQEKAKEVHAAAGSEGQYPAALPAEAPQSIVYRSYQIRYVTFEDETGKQRSHFRIEATRRCRYCRALPSLTITDDGTVYLTEEKRPATPTDRVFYKPGP